MVAGGALHALWTRNGHGCKQTEQLKEIMLTSLSQYTLPLESLPLPVVLDKSDAQLRCHWADGAVRGCDQVGRGAQDGVAPHWCEGLLAGMQEVGTEAGSGVDSTPSAPGQLFPATAYCSAGAGARCPGVGDVRMLCPFRSGSPQALPWPRPLLLLCPRTLHPLTLLMPPRIWSCWPAAAPWSCTCRARGTAAPRTRSR